MDAVKNHIAILSCTGSYYTTYVEEVDTYLEITAHVATLVGVGECSDCLICHAGTTDAVHCITTNENVNDTRLIATTTTSQRQ